MPGMMNPPPPMPNNEEYAYDQEITAFLTQEYSNLDEDTKKERIGDIIYSRVQDLSGEEQAPKITGMIIDLPESDLIGAIRAYADLKEKVVEGMSLLNQDGGDEDE